MRIPIYIYIYICFFIWSGCVAIYKICSGRAPGTQAGSL